MNALFNWLAQIASVTAFAFRTLPQRLGSASAAAIGIAGVVAVLVGVLSIAEGFRKAMTVSGSPDIAIVLRSGANDEMTSGLSREDVRVISDAPGVARSASGPLASAELFVIINLPKRSTGTDANVPFRGVGREAMAVRGNVKIVQGRDLQPGRNEIIAGVGAAREFAGLDVGKQIKLGQNEWQVVGLFEAGGGIAESEVWTDAAVLQPAYHRGDTFQSDYVRLASIQSFQRFKDSLVSNPQLNVKVVKQTDFYADQATRMTEFIQTIGVSIGALMALGALFGAINTMYSAVAARTREIATLRALGFGAEPVIGSVLIESLALALAGGCAGAAAAYLAFDGFTASTINYQTFSQVTFAFAVTPRLLANAVALAAALGLVGGLFPAIRAARMPIATALRET